MKITILGTGTSHGVPVVNCHCDVCRSTVKENKRSRCSVYVEHKGTGILIDTATEFRLQALEADISVISGILYTHAHADHLHGLDDIRPFSYHREIPAYAKEDVCREIRERFPYIFATPFQKGGGKPRIALNTIGNETFTVEGIEILPIPVIHGTLPVLGYRIGGFAYITDCSSIPEESLALLKGLDSLVIGALRYKPHATHFSIPQALDVIKKISPGRAYLTHICHEVDHFTLKKELTNLNVEPAYDGQIITVTP